MSKKIHHTFTRIAHRHDRTFDPSRWVANNGYGWKRNQVSYICASGLCRHFDIPRDMNELEVNIIVCDTRPDPEAQQIFSYGADDGLRIEREWGPKEENAERHTLYNQFAVHVQSGLRAARKIDSKVWMLCHYARVDQATVEATCGKRL